MPIDTRVDDNGKVIAVDTKAQTINSRTYVPLRFISENMGATVDWKVEVKTLFVYINRPSKDTPLPGVGQIPGTADYKNPKQNMEKIITFFGNNGDKRMTELGNSGGSISYNPIARSGGGTDTAFFYMVDRAGEPVEIVVKDWHVPNTPYFENTENIYKQINPTVKEVLRFYLPKGSDNLYKIIDDGYNWRWDDASKYLNKDISNMIGSDGKKVMLYDGDGGLRITIK